VAVSERWQNCVSERNGATNLATLKVYNQEPHHVILPVQDPYLKSEEYGQTIDEVENLIKKHEAFEKAAAAQEERFAALERLTTVIMHSSLLISGYSKTRSLFFYKFYIFTLS
jgi:hypothetical protein